jgi:hypothetical protein
LPLTDHCHTPRHGERDTTHTPTHACCCTHLTSPAAPAPAAPCVSSVTLHVTRQVFPPGAGNHHQPPVVSGPRCPVAMTEVSRSPSRRLGAGLLITSAAPKCFYRFQHTRGKLQMAGLGHTTQGHTMSSTWSHPPATYRHSCKKQHPARNPTLHSCTVRGCAKATDGAERSSRCELSHCQNITLITRCAVPMVPPLFSMFFLDVCCKAHARIQHRLCVDRVELARRPT